MIGPPSIDGFDPVRARRRRLWLTAVLVVSGVTCGVLAAVFLPDRGSDAHRSVGGLDVVGWSLSGVGVIGVVVTTVWACRTGALRRGRSGLVLGLDRTTRRRAMRAVRGQEPVADRDREVAVELARSIIDRRWLLASNSSLLVLFAGQLVTDETFTSRSFVVVAAVLIAAGLAQTVYDTRRAWRFLARVSPVPPR